MHLPLRINSVQKVTVAAASAQSAALSSSTYAVRLASTTACYFKIDTNPTATTSDNYLPANTVEYLIVTPGQKIAAIQASAGGTLTISECSR